MALSKAMAAACASIVSKLRSWSEYIWRVVRGPRTENPIKAFLLTKGMQTSALTLRRTSMRDRKSTRLNSSHDYISYAVFCLKKKKKCVIVISNDSRHVITVSSDAD